MPVDWQAVAAFKESEEYQRLGVIGRQRLLYERFPEIEARHSARTARHMEEVIHDLNPPTTPDPDAA